ncbi:MAG: energy-coupling factor transporter transmembrane protein EcfT, partial [Clostridiales bacterium]
AIETADSMRSRGYGLPGRSAFALFRWESRDKRVLGTLLLLGCYVLLGSVMDAIYYRYFPSFRMAGLDGFSVSVLVAYLLLCAMPLIIELAEDCRWKHIA